MRCALAGVGCALVLALPAAPVRGEIVEEIVAWVNGTIITKSDYNEEQEEQIRQLQQQYSGAELDQRLQAAHQQLLLAMIDRKVLVHKAKAMGFDLEKVGNELLNGFREDQGVGSDLELDRLLSREGLTRRQARERLIEIQIPREVIRSEVFNRVSVSDAEIQAYYEEHAAEFFVEGSVTLREIVLLADTPASKSARRPEIDELRRRIVAGESFAALAGSVSEAGTREAEGRLGPLRRSELSDLLVGPAFSLPIGQVSDVVETPYGFHMIVVESRQEDHTRPLHEIREELHALLEERKRGAELDALMLRARDESNWCVKPKFQHLLSIASPSCEEL